MKDLVFKYGLEVEWTTVPDNKRKLMAEMLGETTEIAEALFQEDDRYMGVDVPPLRELLHGQPDEVRCDLRMPIGGGGEHVWRTQQL